MKNTKYTYWDEAEKYWNFNIYQTIKELPFKYANPLKYFFRLHFKGCLNDDIHKFCLNYEALTMKEKAELNAIYDLILDRLPLNDDNIKEYMNRSKKLNLEVIYTTYKYEKRGV